MAAVYQQITAETQRNREREKNGKGNGTGGPEAQKTRGED